MSNTDICSAVADELHAHLTENGVDIDHDACLALATGARDDLEAGDWQVEYGAVLTLSQVAFDDLPVTFGRGTMGRDECEASVHAYLGGFADDFDVERIMDEAYDYHRGGLMYHVAAMGDYVARRDPGYYPCVDLGDFAKIVERAEVA